MLFSRVHTNRLSPSLAHTGTGTNGRCHLCDLIKTCLLSFKKTIDLVLCLLYMMGFSTIVIMESLLCHFFSLLFICCNYRRKPKKTPPHPFFSFLFSILSIFLCPVCIQRSSHRCILIRDLFERLPQHVVSSDHPLQLFFCTP